jgi:steroid delta-isomerase-like uncharacterized protein
MLTENNKTIVRLQHDEVWSKGNLAIVDEIYAPNFICHPVGGPEWRGREGVRQIVTRHRTSFPDWHEQIEDIIIEGDRVVTRFTSRGTHKGEFRGIPPTGNQVTIAEVAIYRIAEGKIAEQWVFPDEMELLRQVGAGPNEPDE